MARVTKAAVPYHTFELTADDSSGRLWIVGSGKRAYLWTGRIATPGQNPVTFSGRVALRKLARAILKQVR